MNFELSGTLFAYYYSMLLWLNQLDTILAASGLDIMPSTKARWGRGRTIERGLKMVTTYYSCPWGVIQDSRQVIPGIKSVSTASHGGLLLSPQRQEQMPEYLRTEDRWYEEDCEWARVYCVFATEIISAYFNNDDENAPYELKNVGYARQCLKNWCPDGYELFFGEEIPAGESYIREHPLKIA